MLKATNGKGNKSSRDEWKTPQWLFDILNTQYGFTFDCCANDRNKKCKEFSSEFEKLNTRNGAIYWMNPPFSLAYQMFRHFAEVVIQGIAIYRCDNFETAIWQDVILPNCDWVFVPNKRINYEGLSGEGVRFPSALIGIGLPEPVGLEGRLLRGDTKTIADQNVSNGALIDYIENDAEIAMPIDELIHEDGRYLTKKEYGKLLLKYLVKELREHYC